MFRLTNKEILVLSPEGWGKMYLSKHHYALALAEAGNTVYFLKPPSQLPGNKKFRIDASGIHPNLFFIEHRLSFPFNLRFHALFLFHFFMRRHIRQLLRAIPRKIDIIWSFDLLYLYPLNFFPSRLLKIFHPVDEPLHRNALSAGRGAHIIFSVTREILEKYAGYHLPSHLVHHGVAQSFFSNNGAPRIAGNPVRVGLSGNLLRGDVDRPVMLQIMRENREVIFECWGSYHASQSNIGGSITDETTKFVEELKNLPNVILHGAVVPATLAVELHRMDAFLICYDVQKDQSRGTNYHKIMEYLTTGKVIVSNNVTAYKDEPDLVQMVEERNNNDKLPLLFKHVIADLQKYNAYELQSKRVTFARENTYQKHILTIERRLDAIVTTIPK